MNLKCLLLSSDDKTVRVLRRVLSDLEIELDHCAVSDDVIRRITRQRFEALIIDCDNPEKAGEFFRVAKAAPTNKRAVSIALVESVMGLKGGFDMGAHFVLHKPLAVERAKASFRAVRALMKCERRLQMRVNVEIPVECIGSSRYPAKTLDICEGGMAIQFTANKPKERLLCFAFGLPGTNFKIDVIGETAWEGNQDQVGVRFQKVPDEQRSMLRNWLNRQLFESEPDDPPVVCRLSDLSPGGCYLTTNAPFPKFTRVLLSIQGFEARVSGIVRLAHSEYGMGVEFLRSTTEQREQVQRLTEALRSGGKNSELHVEPVGLESYPEATVALPLAADDILVSLFRQQSQLPVDAFMEKMKQR